ncbi:VOC family protein [Alicyclobacillus cycloheptanicus]|uniref:Catechol 2,3-dioxygenase-like lactoylglutathione lyase family enzyme n=1 Tax=Alicyclobacillus cycloheptanicus TaxID=1457 RepID=A0ABT9XGE4_9BACL|nr:VOC family protein [Alicyclobacillus cycloheptanicus]MDQ0188898.1 catechol 2,3-dioxygenase-like lactoylglutathione lyase family enzyme [Alicyclobacillus cycloheptanicus]WDM01748.1 VOC family protein [Alicyclobacillus cycloheptanicus]
MFKSANVTVMTADMKRAIQFYVETLGLKLLDEFEGHFAQVQAPGLTIGLLHIEGEQGPTPAPSGSMSIGFEVESLSAAMETLKSRGVEFHDPVDGEAAQVVHFNDPDGNTLYLVRSR